MGNATFQRACQLVKAGDFAGAVPILQELVAERPDDVKSVELLAYCHFELGHMSAAVEQAHRVVELTPHRARAWCNLGTVLRKLGRLDEAAAAQMRALELDPSYSRASTELAKIKSARATARCASCGREVLTAERVICSACGRVYHLSCVPSRGCACGASLVASAGHAEMAGASHVRRRTIFHGWVAVGLCGVAVLIALAAAVALFGVLHSPGQRGLRLMRRAVLKHAAGRYAEAVRLYERAAEVAPGLAVASVGRALAELEVNPFFLANNTASFHDEASRELLSRVLALCEQAKWGHTSQLDRAEAAAATALQALVDQGPGYKEQLAAGFGADETAAFAWSIMASTSLIRGLSCMLAFVDQVHAACDQPGRLSENLAALRNSSALSLCLQWCQQVLWYAEQCDRACPSLNLAASLVVAANETAKQATEMSFEVADLEETARSLEDLQDSLDALVSALPFY